MVTVGSVLAFWEGIGVFYFVIPFLLVFAIVFALLEKIQIFKGNNGNGSTKAIHTIIAVAIGLLAIQFPMVPLFFMNIFPKLGVFLAVVLTIMILLGFTGVTVGSQGNGWVKYIGVAAAALVVLWALGDFAWFGGLGSFSFYAFIYSDYFWSLVILGGVGFLIYWVGKSN
jgi:hypothetical protein